MPAFLETFPKRFPGPKNCKANIFNFSVCGLPCGVLILLHRGLAMLELAGLPKLLANQEPSWGS